MLEHQEKIESITKKIIDEFHPQKIILFGSCARRQQREYSDIDLIIVFETDKPFVERIADCYRRLRPRFALDLLAYTPEEFDRLVEENRFVKHAVKEGVVIYAKEA